MLLRSTLFKNLCVTLSVDDDSSAQIQSWNYAYKWSCKCVLPHLENFIEQIEVLKKINFKLKLFLTQFLKWLRNIIFIWQLDNLKH